MIYEVALDLVEATTKCLKAAVAARNSKGASALPHVESLVREARLTWGDACEAESEAWAEAHAGQKAPGFPQETLPLGKPAETPADAEASLVPPLEATGASFHETQAHADLPTEGDEVPPLVFDEIEPPLTSAEGTVGE